MHFDGPSWNLHERESPRGTSEIHLQLILFLTSAYVCLRWLDPFHAIRKCFTFLDHSLFISDMTIVPGVV